ncbi:MAG: FG-GAP-like repeat-containing protein, partial [Phycisphaerales bacterium]
DSGQALGNSNSQSVALGDLDGDGDLDAMVGNYAQPNRVWINDGAGTFTDSGQALGNSISYSVALGDLDGDGDLDAMDANVTPEPNRVWLNNGTGTFTDSGQALGNAYSVSVALGDLDGDGDLDAMVANAGPNRVWINDGDSIQGTLNVRLGLCFDTVAEAIDASIPNDTLLIGGASLDVAGTIDLRSRPLTFKARSSAPIVGPDLLLLAGSTSSFVSAYDTAFSRYRLQGTMAASNDDSILLSDLQIEAGGTLVQNGSSLLFEKGMHNQGGTAYLEGDLFCFDGEVSTGSAGRNRVAGDTNVLGDYTNAGTTIVQRGILYIYGDLENTGTLTGEVNTGFDGGGEPQPGDGFSIGGSYRVGADANLAMPDPVWQLQVGGDVDIAIDDPARFDMGQATIRLTGLAPAGLQAMETLSEDLGAAEQGFDPSNFPIGTLRITSDSATTLVNNHVNSTADPCEALYVERLVVEKGAFLWTNGCRIYTREAEIFGEVDGLDDIVIVEGCPGDLNGDGMVGPADLSLLFGVWNTDGSVVAGSDIDGDGLVDGSDLGVMLIEWGLCL